MGSIVPPSPQQVDFDKFTVLGLNIQQKLRDISAIIQNSGHNVKEADAIDEWTLNAQQDLASMLSDANRHILRVSRRLKNQDYEKEPLGYYRDGAPIFPLSPGMMATACILGCSSCRKVIRGMGGPASGAKCVECFNKEQQ